MKKSDEKVATPTNVTGVTMKEGSSTRYVGMPRTTVVVIMQ